MHLLDRGSLLIAKPFSSHRSFRGQKHVLPWQGSFWQHNQKVLLLDEPLAPLRRKSPQNYVLVTRLTEG